MLGTVKLKHRNSAISPSTRGRDVANELTARKNISKVFTIVFFFRDLVFRQMQLAIGWTEQKCIEMVKLAQQDHTYRLSKEEFKRFQGQWYPMLNKAGKNAPRRLRSDFRAAVSIKKPSPSRIRRRSWTTHFSSTVSEMALFLERFLAELGHVQKLVELMSSIQVIFCCSRFRLQLIAIYCKQRSVYTDTPHTSLFLLHSARVSWCVIHHIGSSVCTSASRHLHGHPCRAFDLLSLFLALFVSVCLSCPLLFSFFFYLNPELNLFLHVVVIGAVFYWHSANWGVWRLGRKHHSHRLWAQRSWRLPLLRDHINHLFKEQSSDAVPS